MAATACNLKKWLNYSFACVISTFMKTISAINQSLCRLLARRKIINIRLLSLDCPNYSKIGKPALFTG